jgi:hypothetical protein
MGRQLTYNPVFRELSFSAEQPRVRIADFRPRGPHRFVAECLDDLAFTTVTKV